jgi:orotidine-5'-phosphate decarboxylase
VFADALAERVRRFGPTCVGLDPHLDRIPADLGTGAGAARAFCLGAIEAVADKVAAVKPQVAFFEALGPPGVQALVDVVRASREAGLLVVLDAKRGDIGSTAKAYAHATIGAGGPMGADSVTLSPYLGPESLAPFLGEVDLGRGVFILVRTSNPGAGGWQGGGIADQVAAWIALQNEARLGANGLGPVGAVVGATLPGELAHWRAAMPNAWILAPGYGAQGASATDTLPLFRSDGLGALVVSARGVLFGRNPEVDWRGGIARRASAFQADLQAALR